MEQVNIYEAKTHFSKYIEKAEAGQDAVWALWKVNFPCRTILINLCPTPL